MGSVAQAIMAEMEMGSVRRRSAFLKPGVCFTTALTGRILTPASKRIFGVKSEIAELLDADPAMIFLYDDIAGHQVDESRDSFAEHVLVRVRNDESKSRAAKRRISTQESAPTLPKRDHVKRICMHVWGGVFTKSFRT